MQKLSSAHGTNKSQINNKVGIFSKRFWHRDPK